MIIERVVVNFIDIVLSTVDVHGQHRVPHANVREIRSVHE